MMKTTDRPIGKVQAQDLQRDVAMDLRKVKRLSDEAISSIAGAVAGLDSRLSSLGAKSFLPCRQTVCASKMDSDGKPAFLSINGNDVDILATASPLVMGFAEGFNQNGALDYIKRLTADVASAFSGFQALAPNYLYALLGEDGEVTFGHTPYQPQYGHAFDKSGFSLLHFEGADGSTTITDEWGHSWVASGHAHIETDDKKFGSTSLYLDGTGDYITSNTRLLGREFTIEMWVKPTNFSAQRYIFSSTQNYTLSVGINTAGKLILYVGQVSSWSLIDGGVASTALNVGAWNHVAVTYDGAYYRMYANGSLVYEVAKGLIYQYSSAVPGFRIGSAYNGETPFLGYIDEVRITSGAVVIGGSTYTEPTAPYALPDVYFFNIPEMMMYKGNTTFSPSRTLFLGESPVDGSGTPSSVVCYALNGRAEMPEQYITQYTPVAFADNIGCVNKAGVCLVRMYLPGNYSAANIVPNYWRNTFTFATSVAGNHRVAAWRTF